MAENIIFYKLQSPYSGDTTLNCKLTVEDLDQNFLTFKDYDIKDASYNAEDMTITINRNNGETINIDISDIDGLIGDKIEEAVSGLTPSGSTEYDIDITGELSEDGILTLRWTTPDGGKETEISGFLTERKIYIDETISGDGSDSNPLRISNVEKTGAYKAVVGIVDELPGNNLTVGDRYVTKESVSSFGRMYNKQGLDTIKRLLASENSVWRIPTKEDWDKLLNYADVCDEHAHDREGVNEYFGDVAGRMLKSVKYWEGYENLDKYGFTAYPAGYVSDYTLEGADQEARFWTDTMVGSGSTENYIKGFSYNHDNALQTSSEEGGWYSIRLVSNIGSVGVTDKVNILGNTYDIINIGGIGLVWTTLNLRVNIGSSRSEQYVYDHEGLVKEKYVLNHWNGSSWEKKELNEGDTIIVTERNNVTEYKCVVDGKGNQNLVKGLVYQVKNDTRKLVLDAGWY